MSILSQVDRLTIQGKRIKPRRATLGCNRRSMKLLAACLGGLFSSSFPALSNLKPCDASLPCFPRCDPYGYAHSLRENSCREPSAACSLSPVLPNRTPYRFRVSFETAQIIASLCRRFLSHNFTRRNNHRHTLQFRPLVEFIKIL